MQWFIIAYIVSVIMTVAVTKWAAYCSYKHRGIAGSLSHRDTPFSTRGVWITERL